MSLALWALTALGVLLVGLELAGRLLGLHRPVLYERTAYGYRAKPAQDTRVLGRRASYDAAGLRSAPLAPGDAAGWRVLCLGDSITNGGWQTDQADTWPLQLERVLVASGQKARVLNASAGGWSLHNQLGWVRAHGLQGATVLLLQVGSNDLFQPGLGAHLVGAHPSFPEHPPVFALTGIVNRFLLPRVKRRDPGEYAHLRTLEVAVESLGALHALVSEGRRLGAEVRVLFVEQPAGLEPVDPVTREAKRRMFEMLDGLAIPWARAAQAMAAAGGATLFRDGMHPNGAGNQVLAQVAAELLRRPGAAPRLPPEPS